MGDPGDYIGSKISLISRSEIRYEGILHSINNVDSSLTLQNVKSYGTEGRKQIGPQIPPSAEIYDYIMFKGTDIKDIQIDQVRSTAAPDIPLSIPRRFHRSFPPSNQPYTRSRPNLASSADSIVPPSRSPVPPRSALPSSRRPHPRPRPRPSAR
jgi:protein LSM14